MKSRIICGFLAAILALQTIPQGVYGMESSGTIKSKQEFVEENTMISSEGNIAEEIESGIYRDIKENEKKSIEEDSSGKEENGISVNTVGDENVGIIEEEITNLATFSNIYIEKTGYQYARIVMDIELADGIAEPWDWYGGVVCSEDSLSTEAEYNSGVQRIYEYRDESGYDVKNRFYIDVKVHGGQTYTYTPFVQVTNAEGTNQIVSAKESVDITGKKFEDLSPSLRFDSGITKAILWLDVTGYDYSLDSYLDADIYYRKIGNDSWIDGGSLNSKDGRVTIEGLEASSEYEAYIELIHKFETEKKVVSAVCSFQTEEDVVYDSDIFPDSVFYEYILERCGGKLITQSKLNEILNIQITEDNIEDNIPVQSIEGIQYLKNLEGITISGQDITDVSVISELEYLKSINLESNELTSLPDMSGMLGLSVINFDYNKISASEIVESKLPKNSSLLGTNKWIQLEEHQVGSTIKIQIPEVCYGWGTSQPIVLGIRNLKDFNYTLELNVNGTTFKTESLGEGSNYDYKIKGFVIPNTGLQLGTYKDVRVTVYDCYGRQKAQSVVEITLVEDAATIYTTEIGIGTTGFQFDGVLPGIRGKITSAKLLKEGEVYGETVYISSYSSTYGETRYQDFLYGGFIRESLFECERNVVDYNGSINITRTLTEGDYDIEFNLEDGTTITKQSIIHINEEARVYSLDDAYALREYKNIYSNSGDYIYAVLRGYNLDSEKVWPEIYFEDTVLTSYDGLELEEETETVGMRYYVYRLKKLETDKYWKKSGNFRWKLCTAEGYRCHDLADGHGYSYTYTDGIEFGTFWVDEHLTENTCKIYVKSSLPNNTSVKVTASERLNTLDSYQERGTVFGMGILNNGILTFDLYDENQELFYPSLNNLLEYLFEFTVDGEVIKVQTYAEVYRKSYQGYSQSRPGVLDEREGAEAYIVQDISPEGTVFGIQWGKDTIESYRVNFYLPNTNEKKLSLDVSEDELEPYKAYFFTKEDIQNLDSTEIYRIEVSDKNGVRLLYRFYARVTSKIEESTVILPTEVTLTPASRTLGLNKTVWLTAIVSPSNATDKTITWQSDNTDVATVDNTGLVKTVGYGKATIKASTVNGKKATCTINVASNEPTEIKLSPKTASVAIGSTLQLTATIIPENATDKTIIWTSDNNESVMVNQEGLVTAVNPGKAIIEAETVNGKTASCTVIAYNPDSEEILLKPGETSQIPVPEGINSKGLKYKSDNESVVTVDSKGVLSAVGIGNTKVTQQSGDILITYIVIVTNPLQKLSFEESEVMVEIDNSVTNRIVFDPVYTDSNKIVSIMVEDNTIAKATIVNGKIITITGLSEGKTAVKVTCGELETICNVTVQKPVEVPDISQHKVYALTNRHKTLADIREQLLPGFEFMDPEIILSKFAGENEKEFAVLYTDKNGRTKQTVQRVKLLTISGIVSVLDKMSVEVESEEKATLTPNCIWSGSEAEDSIKEQLLQGYEFEVISNKGNIVEIQSSGQNFLLSGMKEGKEKLTVILREKGTQGKTGILYQEKIDFIVSEKVPDIEINVTGASYKEEGGYYYINDISSSEVNISAVADGYKITWSSSDAGIAKVEKGKNGISKVSVKTNGKVKLTATTNDTAKTSKSILLYIIDAKPSIDSEMTINKAHENGGTLGIYASYGYDIGKYDVQLMQKDNIQKNDSRFLIDYNSQKDIYEVMISDDNQVSQGKYEAVVKVTAETEAGKKEYYSDLAIKVINKPVTYAVKQNKKVNLFYTDTKGNGELTVTCKNAEIEDVKLSDCDFSYDFATRSLRFDGTDYENADKTGVLNIKFKDYSEVSKKITISTENKKPSIIMSATSSMLYPNAGIKKAQLQIKEKNTKEQLWIENKNIFQENLETDEYCVYATQGDIYLQLKENINNYPKTAKIKFALQMDNWNEEITFTHTVKCQLTGNPTLELSSSTMTLNKNASVARYQEADVNVKIKNATDSTIIDSVVISGADKKALNAMDQGIDFVFEPETGTITASFNNSSVVNKGTYNYNIHTQIVDGKNIKTKMKVSVIDKDTVIGISTKGTLDILDRGNSSIICTPQLKNISGEITEVALTGANAHLFDVKLDHDGKAVITAKEKTAYITKYPYKVQLLYTLMSGGRLYTVSSKPIIIKVKQGAVNVVSNLSSSHLYQAADNSLNVNLAAIHTSGESLTIKEVSIVETKNMKDVFYICYNEDIKSYQLSLKDATKVKKGKKYSIKLNVKFADQADNEKAKIVTVKVMVK